MSPRRLATYLLLAAALGALAAVGVQLARRIAARSQVLDSGGPLDPLEAAYDVRRYELAVRLHPASRTIDGRLAAEVVSVARLDRFVVDLDRRLRVAALRVDGRPARFRHRRGRIEVSLAAPWSAGERHRVEVDYGGRPKVSEHPPWIDGFVWARTPSGAPWIGVTCQIDGADDWWPTKDHPSDEPDEGMAIELTVPAGLVGLANGRKVGETTNADGSVTSRWESAPINNYLVTVAAAPYVEVDETYRGADGTLAVPMRFWALPEHLARARAMWREAPPILAAFARWFGEFPFLADKIGAVEAPFDGMEHQTLIAFGEGLERGPSGRYETLAHELAHEWWGNKVSARDWDDFWIQEGFASYAEILWIEASEGAAAARDQLEQWRLELDNRRPLTAGRPRTAAAAYDVDIYDKGAWVLATLRWQVGDESFFRILRRFAGPVGETRLVDSAELERLVAAETGRDLGWFWQRYLRRSEPPRWVTNRHASGDADGEERVCFRWTTPGFELALPVRTGEAPPRRVEMPGGAGCVEVAAGTAVAVEPAGRILAEPVPEAGAP